MKILHCFGGFDDTRHGNPTLLLVLQ